MATFFCRPPSFQATPKQPETPKPSSIKGAFCYDLMSSPGLRNEASGCMGTGGHL